MPKLNISTRGNRGLDDVNYAQLRAVFAATLISGAVVIDTDANDIKTTVAMTFVIDGVLYSKGTFTGENVTITAADDDSTSQAANTTCYYVYCLDSSGNVEGYKGVDDKAFYPAIPDDRAPFAVAKIVTTAAFTLGTTDYDATGITTTWTNVSHIPAAVV